MIVTGVPADEGQARQIDIMQCRRLHQGQITAACAAIDGREARLYLFVIHLDADTGAAEQDPLEAREARQQCQVHQSPAGAAGHDGVNIIAAVQHVIAGVARGAGTVNVSVVTGLPIEGGRHRVGDAIGETRAAIGSVCCLVDGNRVVAARPVDERQNAVVERPAGEIHRVLLGISGYPVDKAGACHTDLACHEFGGGNAG